MKKILALTLSLASIGFVASSAEAKANDSIAKTAIAASAAPQVRIQLGGGRRNGRFNRRAPTVTQTRFVRAGRRVYRETYQITYWPNGGTQTRLISRVRVR
jgi:hypothetical protein